MEEDNNHLVLIIGSLSISFIFIIVVAIVIYYLSKKDDDSGSGSTAEHREINSQSHEGAHRVVSEQQQAAIDQANEHLRNNGLPQFQLSSDILDPYGPSTVSIVNASGGKQVVDVCSNNEGFQPLYDGIGLACPDGLISFSHQIPGQNDWYCCMLPDDPVNLSSDEGDHTSSRLANIVGTNLQRIQSAPDSYKLGLVGVIGGITQSSKFRSLLGKIVTSPYKFMKFVSKVSSAKEAAIKKAKSESGFKKAANIVSGPFKFLKKKIVSLQLALLRRVGASLSERGLVTFPEKITREVVEGQVVERGEKLIFKKLRNNIAKGSEGYFTNKFINAVAQKAATEAEEKLGTMLEEEALKETRAVAQRQLEKAGATAAEKALARETIERASVKLAERLALEGAIEIAAEAAAVAAEGSICTSGVIAMGAACPETLGLGCVGALALGVSCLAAMVATVGGDVGMLFDIMYMAEKQCDIDGWSQYQSNGEKIITYRDQIEGKKITNNSIFDMITPFTFDLSNIEYLITLNVDEEHAGTPKSITSAQIHDLRNIYDIYLLAHTHYQNSLPTFKPEEPTEHNMIQINDAMDNDVELNFDVIQRMLTNIHDYPTERDDHIWEFMKTHLNTSNKTESGTDNLKYIRYVRTMSKGKGQIKPIIGITLNDEGIAIFNKEASALNDGFNKDDIVNVSGVSQESVAEYLNSSGANPTTSTGDPTKLQSMIPLLVNSKYYRDIFDKHDPLDEHGVVKLEQKELDAKFTLESPSKYLIEKYCTEGMDKDKLPGKVYMAANPGTCNTFDEEWIHPKDHGVTYNNDTGLCNYTDDYCTSMGFGAKEEKSFRGVGERSYFDCEESDSQENWSLIFGEYLTKRYAT